MNGIRALIALAVVAGFILYLNFPDRVPLIVLGDLAVVALLFWVTMRPVPEPDRAIVYRLATFDHVAGPGYVFVIPTIERIMGTLDMSVRPLLSVEVTQVRAADGDYVRTNLEVSWRIHPSVRGRVPEKIRNMIFMSDEQRKSLVEETVMTMARQVVNSYNAPQLAPASAREAAAATIMDGANEILESHGLMVERIFWRGSPFPRAILEAKLASAVEKEHAESLIATVEAIRKRLPDMQPEEFLALQAWLDMFRRGGQGGPPAPPKT